MNAHYWNFLWGVFAAFLFFFSPFPPLTNIINLHIALLCQMMTCIWIHIWTSAYMLNSVLDLISLFLFLGDNVPGCCYYQRYQNRKICQTSKSEFITVISCPFHCLLIGIPATISAGMQIRCQSPSLAFHMSSRFAMQKCQMYFTTLFYQYRKTQTRQHTCICTMPWSEVSVRVFRVSVWL